MALTKAKKKNTGQFDCHVELQNYIADDSVSGGDGLGGGGTEAGGSWQSEATFWARIRPIKGYERLKLDAQDSTVDSVIEFRFVNYDLSAESRILFKGRAYNIHYVLVEDEQDCYFEVAASYEVL